jgi:hypothetical protein
LYAGKKCDFCRLHWRKVPAARRAYATGRDQLWGFQMAAVIAEKSGTFRIGANAEVHRLGFGIMRLTGEGI